MRGGRIARAGLGAALLPLAAASAKAASLTAAPPPVDLHCTVTAPAKLRRGLTDEAVCARFVARFREALGRPVRRIAQPPLPNRGRWIRLEVRLLPRDRAEAVLTSRLHGKATAHPAMAVQVMDKALGIGEIDRLARQAGEVLAGRRP